MSDEQEKVDAGSETSSVEAPAAETPEVPAQAETPADAEVAAEKTPEASDASRTGYAEKGLRAGDACICPDGRGGTVHQYDAGLICIPNQDQG